jgi:hypothetical protein
MEKKKEIALIFVLGVKKINPFFVIVVKKDGKKWNETVNCIFETQQPFSVSIEFVGVSDDDDLAGVCKPSTGLL